jgi:hypothetical protein
MENKNVFRYILAAIIIISLIVVMVFMFAHNDGGRYDSPINLCVGALLGAFTTVYTYEFGSSKGSNEKTKMLYNSTPTLPMPEESLKG